MADALRRDRQIRVFISSTFRDMQEERDELIKRVFPQLRRLCEDRGVTFTEVDLRWGVTDEEAAEGKVLPICLSEIERCRPFFIGLLGERYGWVPQEIPAELIALQPWLAEHRQKSVTELEILHGVLKNSDMANRAMFYFRDPAYLDRIPAEHRNEFREHDSTRIARLAALKEQIRQARLVWRENYPDPVTLGQWVQEDLTVAINQEFPPGKVPDPLDRDAAEHDAFARSRTGVYIGRPEYFDTLDRHSAADAPPLVVLGGSGSGKSAMLANWAVKYREAHPDTLVLMHFVGATRYSADWAAMLRRVMGELKRRFHIAEEIPDKPEALRAAFANWLHMAGRVVLVLDGLNQLEDRDGAPDLVWLPLVIPTNVRMVLSTLPGRAWTELQKRAWPTFCVKPLERDERRRLIVQYLAQFTKRLSPQRIERVVRAGQAANPLYLRALLDELRVFGAYEQLDQRIDHYLATQSVPDLYSRILERWEADYERDRPGMVREAMTALWAARQGLSESELLDVLGTGGEALPHAAWSPFFLAVERSLVVRSGLIGFFHDHVREAVRWRYVFSDQSRQKAHLLLADYFQAQDLGRRQVDELPWQLALARSWPRLHALLATPAFFERAWQERKYDVLWCLREVEIHSPLRLVDAVARLGAERTRPGVQFGAAELLMKHGEHRVACRFFEELEALFRTSGDLANVQATVGNQAICLVEMNELATALEKFEEQGRLARRADHRAGIINSLQGQAATLYKMGRPEQARLRLEELEALRRGSNPDLSSGELGVAGAILLETGELAAALEEFEEQERIALEAGREDELLGCWGNMAHALQKAGRLVEAEKVVGKLEEASRKRSDVRALLRALVIRADLAVARGNGADVYKYYRDQEPLCRQLQDHTQLAISLSGQAVHIAHDLGLYDMAMRKAEEACRLTQSLPHQQRKFFLEACEQVRRLRPS